MAVSLTFFPFISKYSLTADTWLQYTVVFEIEDDPKYLLHVIFNPLPNTPFQTIPNSKKLQMTTDMWLLKDLKIQTA